MIPNKIILTFRNYDVPDYVFHNIKKLNQDKEILFFTDEDVIKFLLKEYDSSYVDFFHSVKLGCTKGDLFRYCYLLKYGGYYCDIDIQHYAPIKDYIKKDVEFFSVNSGACANTTFQALLFAESDHPVIKKCIEDIMKPESSECIYYKTTSDMYKNIKSYLDIDGNYCGDYNVSNGKIVSIAQEMAINNTWCCVYENKIIALSRYPSYQKVGGGTSKETGFFVQI